MAEEDDEGPPAPSTYGSIQKEESYTVQEALNHGGLGLGNALPISAALLCQVAEAAEYMILGTVLPKLRCEWKLTRIQVALVPFVIIISAISGGVVGAHVLTRFGRYYPILIGMLLSAIAAITSALAQNFVQFLIARGTTVALLEIATSGVMSYLVEYSPTSARSLVFTLLQLSYALGSLLSALTSLIFLESAGWRVVLLILTIPGFAGVALIATQRETPFYDVACDRVKEAQETLSVIWKLNRVKPLSGQLEKHEVGNPVEVSLLQLPYTDTGFLRHTVAFMAASIALYQTWTITIFGAPRMLNEGYCDSVAQAAHNHTKNCYTYSGKSLSMLVLATTGEGIGSVVLLAININIGRILVFRAGLGGMATTVLAFLVCFGGTIKLTLNFFLLKFFHVANFMLFKLYMSEYYSTEYRAMLFGYLASTGRLFSVISAVAALLLEIRQFEYLIVSVGMVGIVAFGLSFLFQKETRTIALT